MTDNKGKIEGIHVSAVVTIEIGGGLYARLRQIMETKMAQKSVEDFKKVLTYLQGGGKPRDLYEYEVETFISLLYEIETAAKEQGKLSYFEPSEIIKL